MANFGFGCRFHDLNYFGSWNSLSYSLKSLSTWWHRHKSLWKTIKPLAPSSKICRFFLDLFLEKNCHYNLLGFVDQYVLKCLRFFSSQKSKLVYSFKSLSLNTRHGSRGIHFTVLHNPDKYFIIYLSTRMPRY